MLPDSPPVPASTATPPLAGAIPPVLMYHSITDYTEDPYLVTVSPRRFAEQLRWLDRHGLHGVSMRDLLAAVDRGGGERLVGLTFDDGYSDFVDHALPVLQRYGFGATVFVLAGKLGGRNDWDREGPVKPLMTAEDVRGLSRAGIEVGSHGLGHCRLTEVGESARWLEVTQSRAILESILGTPVRGFCYPYGDLDSDTVTAVANDGYEYAVATWPSGRRDRHALPRTFVGERDRGVRLRAKLIRHRRRWSGK